MRDQIELKGNWNETKKKFKAKFSILTDHDLLLIEGRQNAMFLRIQEKLGLSREEIRKLIFDLEVPDDKPAYEKVAKMRHKE
jgi:uncharacterized protein YjbJ (UPF0337 family)